MASHHRLHNMETFAESHGNNHDENTKTKWHKLVIPIFLGKDAHGWISKLEQYFCMREVSEEEKMTFVILALEWDALGWYQWWESCNPKTWLCMSAAIGSECFGEKKGFIDRTLFRFSSESHL